MNFLLEGVLEDEGGEGGVARRGVGEVAVFGEAEEGDEAAGEGFVLTHQAQQQMLRLDRGRAELRCFVASKENHPSRFFSVAFEHRGI